MASIATHTPNVIMLAGAGDDLGRPSINFDADPVRSVSDNPLGAHPNRVVEISAAVAKAYVLTIGAVLESRLRLENNKPVQGRSSNRCRWVQKPPNGQFYPPSG
ncbi:hypothetical protein ACH47V_05965 [Micromonospora chersina]|uniref:hypothetical protein n=1 Tax=Micromonospora chersina TaxID=47854 RepID=UPI0033E8627C